jgi:hypothetical protein
MAGKKGMKHRRPRTQEEKDTYALARIEQIYDEAMENHILRCEKCKGRVSLKDVPPHIITLMNKRYDKLRATKTEATITHKQGWTEAIAKVSQADQQVTPAPAQDEDRPAVH